MALWKCKQCGDKVSTKADACPFCGAERRRRHPVMRALVAIFAVLVLWLWISSLFLDGRYSGLTITGPPKTGESEGEPNVASAAVRTDSLSLSIQNLDTFDWSSLRVFLNGTPGWDAYEATYGQVLSGATVTIPLRRFTKKGNRFDLGTMAPTRVWVKPDGFDANAYDL